MRFVTPGVADLNRASEFYRALGWQSAEGPPDDVVFFQAGGTIGREPTETFWGGYSAVVTDPDGHPWEVAHNPGWTLHDDGSVSLAQ
ncbi:MAG: VOC family protein [Nocardioidaceae bacterium]